MEQTHSGTAWGLDRAACLSKLMGPALLVLAGCGGGESGVASNRAGLGTSAPPTAESTPVRPLAAAPAVPSINETQLMNWAQSKFPDLFPAAAGGNSNLRITLGGKVYTYRYYPSTGNYLGVGDVDRGVYGLGPSMARC